jgi:extradiol dioxygenase family protein
MEWGKWHLFKNHLQDMDVEFRLKPHVRYPGKVGEQATMFIDDPSGNALEFKSFQNDERLFATLPGDEHVAGGGTL